MAEEYSQEGIDALTNTGRPIPGQSLLSDPEAPRPFETAPEFTEFKEALNYITELLLEEDIYISLVSGIGAGVPISDVALQILQKGFQEGKWNPDLLLLLIEPLMYVLMALCEKAAVDYRIYGDEEEDVSSDEQLEIDEGKAKSISDMAKEKAGKISDIPQGAIPADIIKKIEALEVPPSLLAKTEQAPLNEESAQPESLLSRTE